MSKPKLPFADGYDREISIKGIVGFLVVLTVITAAAFGLMYFLQTEFRDFANERDRPRSPLAEANEFRPPPEPSLQASPREDFLQFRAAEERMLNSYEMIDAENGIARVPIDEAMRFVAEQGLPEWPAPTPTPEAVADEGVE